MKKLQLLYCCCLERVFLDFIRIPKRAICCERSIRDVRQNIQPIFRIDSSQSKGHREKSNCQRKMYFPFWVGRILTRPG